jgi:hypothetical protein
MMSQSAAGDFVKSLRDEITRKKEKIQTKRNLLQESLDLILGFFSQCDDTEVRSVRNFEINEIATYFDMYIADNVEQTVSRILTDKKINFQRLELNDYKCVFVIDLERKLLSSGNSHNLISLEVCSKRLKTYKFKASICENDFCYSVFDWGYHEIKLWCYFDGKLNLNTLNIRGADRSKKKLKIKDFTEEIDAVVHFNETGRGESLDLFPKKRKKNEEASYNT